MAAKEIFSIQDAVSIRNISSGKTFRFPELGGRYVFFLRNGMLKINFLSDDGRETIKYILKPGNVFGEKSLLDLPADPAEYAVALVDSVVAFVDADTVRERMQRDKEFGPAMLKEIGNRMKKFEDKMLSAALKGTKERVYDILKELAIDFGIQEQDGLVLKNFFTQEDIAKLVSTSRQTVAGIMSELRRNGMIDYNSRVLKIFTRQRMPIVA